MLGVGKITRDFGTIRAESLTLVNATAIRTVFGGRVQKGKKVGGRKAAIFQKIQFRD